ncbi:hypothetical protein T484DRAFT_2198795 [Baffinella frigidus]|nr:hypothetical protein T484DRAFT_2198795 [Cryptophyta sp. CCMP2293]|mmetsp:Transcript_5626/g.13648  ORF Transcript_5626/g.13648 Transcript_5626/m.13648 type:complete len:204 (+) Transcript_5626:132-743(+)
MGRPTRRRPSRNGKSTKVSNAQNARDARGVGYEEGPPPVPGSVPAAGGGAAASPASPRSPSILGRHLVNQGPAIGVLFAAAVVGGAGGGLEVPRTDLSSGSEPHHLGRTPGTLTSQLGGADRDDDVTMEQTKTPRQEMGLVEARGGHQEKNWAERSQPAMPWTNSLEAARHRCPRHRFARGLPVASDQMEGQIRELRAPKSRP